MTRLKHLSAGEARIEGRQQYFGESPDDRHFKDDWMIDQYDLTAPLHLEASRHELSLELLLRLLCMTTSQKT